ncbi:hypothetical protein [Streptomyces roseoverticillatus]|uniref:Uncharacterized protein n=1 Tax=Streptomyces roseoverticillatus TaxID=66429 RepID=A0ABV3J6R4_9ACTN
MMDPSLGRAGYGGYKAARLFGRILNQRRWLWHLRYHAAAKALQLDDSRGVSPDVDQAAKIICEALSYVDLPMEQTAGWVKKTSRLVRENVTNGIRYPEYRGPMRATFWKRLYVWAKVAAESGPGADALGFCGFVESDDRSHIFASRFVAATYELLLDSGLPDAINSVRHDMAEVILHGISDEGRNSKKRWLRAVITSASASATTSVLTSFGFNASLQETAAIGSVTLAATAAVDLVHGSPDGVGDTAAAARRQVRNWLMTLSAWMAGYVTWGEYRLRVGDLVGVDQLVYVLKVMAERGVEIGPIPRDEFIFEDLRHLMENAERARDSRLVAGLMEVQGALRYRRAALPVAIGNLISVVQDVPELPEAFSVASLSSDLPLRLPFARPGDDSQHSPDQVQQ